MKIRTGFDKQGAKWLTADASGRSSWPPGGICCTLRPVAVVRLQYYFHYALLCRAAGLAIGCLTALPFLESRCWRHSAPKQQAAATQQEAGAFQQPDAITSSRQDQRPSPSCEASDAAAPADHGTEAAIKPPLMAVPPLIVALGERGAAAVC
jgi:hypothetical protein